MSIVPFDQSGAGLGDVRVVLGHGARVKAHTAFVLCCCLNPVPYDRCGSVGHECVATDGDSIGCLAFDDVDRQSAARGFLVFRFHVITGFLHGADDFIQRHEMFAVSA